MKHWLRAVALLFCFPASAAVIAESTAVTSPERLATSTGLQILRKGGTAADAAVAAAFALSVLRPETAGIGGGGTALYYDAATGEVWALDFRAEAPNPAYVEGGAPPDAVSLGVPGFVAGMGELYRKFGEVKWRTLMEPAIALAREGTDRARMARTIEDELLSRSVERPSWLGGAGGGISPMVSILERIAGRGADELVLGETSKQLVNRSRELGGLLTPRALAEYAPRWRSPIRIDFRGDQIYTLPSPAGGGNALAEMIAILSGYDWKGLSAGGPESIHMFVEAERSGWQTNRTITAERGTVQRPEVSSPERLSEIRKSIERGPLDIELSGDSTSRYGMVGFVAADDRGNLAVVSLSLGLPSGSGVLVADAFFAAEVPESRTASASVPLLVVRDGQARLGFAVTGSEREAMVGAAAYLNSRFLGSELEDAVTAPRFIPASTPRTVVCERGTNLDLIDKLNSVGDGVEWNGKLGIVHVIERGSSVVAISDPRGGTAGGY